MTNHELLIKVLQLGADISTIVETTNWLSLNLAKLSNANKNTPINSTDLYDCVSSVTNDDTILKYSISVPNGSYHAKWQNLLENELYEVLPDVIRYLESKN